MISSIVTAVLLVGFAATAYQIPAQADQTKASTIKTAAPSEGDSAAARPHNYAYEDDGEYGYQRAISESDAQSGKAQNSLMMIRYMGEKRGVFTVESVQQNLIARLSCKLPCKFLKIQTVAAGQLINTQIMPADGTLGEFIMKDAISGNLKVYAKPQGRQ